MRALPTTVPGGGVDSEGIVVKPTSRVLDLRASIPTQAQSAATVLRILEKAPEPAATPPQAPPATPSIRVLGGTVATPPVRAQPTPQTTTVATDDEECCPPELAPPPAVTLPPQVTTQARYVPNYDPQPNAQIPSSAQAQIAPPTPPATQVAPLATTPAAPSSKPAWLTTETVLVGAGAVALVGIAVFLATRKSGGEFRNPAWGAPPTLERLLAEIDELGAKLGAASAKGASARTIAGLEETLDRKLTAAGKLGPDVDKRARKIAQDAMYRGHHEAAPDARSARRL